MHIEQLVVPQLGEGLQEARIIQLLKQAGQLVKRDEPLYQIETDKAVMDMESPYRGILSEWLVNEGEVVPVGAPIARIETSERRVAKPKTAPMREKPATRTSNRLVIPPRTRAYCRKRGISAEEMAQIPAENGKKLMPQDVDRYLAARSASQTTPPGYHERLLTAQQRILSNRLKRSAQVVVPATLTAPLDWDKLQHANQRLQDKSSGSEESVPLRATVFETLAYCIAQASIQHPYFRSTLKGDKKGDDIVREYQHLNLGVAVHRLNDELVTAVIPHADTLDLPAFVRVAREQITRALNGEDQAIESTQLLLTYMVDYGIIAANPVLVAPAIAIIFVGTPYQQGNGLQANLTITFDHRLINGVAAANFIQAILQQVQTLAADGTSPPASLGGDYLYPKDRATLLAAPGKRDEILKNNLLAEVAHLLKVPVAPLDADVPLRELGINSRLSVELANALTTRFGVPFSATLVWNYPTIRELLIHVAEKLEIPLAEVTKTAPQKENQSTPSRLDEIEAISEDEAALLLAQKLAAFEKKNR